MSRDDPSTHGGPPGGSSDPARLRVDVWLDVSCLFRTRSEAQRACRAGKVEVDGQRVKPHREIWAGCEIVIARPLGRTQRVVVAAIRDRHISRADARALYQDLTPPPSPAEVEQRRIERLARAIAGRSRPAAGAPTKRDRRLQRRLKGSV